MYVLLVIDIRLQHIIIHHSHSSRVSTLPLKTPIVDEDLVYFQYSLILQN